MTKLIHIDFTKNCIIRFYHDRFPLLKVFTRLLVFLLLFYYGVITLRLRHIIITTMTIIIIKD